MVEGKKASAVQAAADDARDQKLSDAAAAQAADLEAKAAYGPAMSRASPAASRTASARPVRTCSPA